MSRGWFVVIVADWDVIGVVMVASFFREAIGASWLKLRDCRGFVWATSQSVQQSADNPGDFRLSFEQARVTHIPRSWR